jgi:PAS domain S-box-containing protein
MSELELSESVKLARERLAALRARLDEDQLAPGSREIVNALGELQQTLDRLQARHALLRDILDRTNDVVFAKHRDGRYAMINPQGADMFGKPIEAIVGADDRAVFQPADAERIMAVDREVISSGRPKTREETCDIRGVRKTLLITTAVWCDVKDQIRGVIGIAQDLTERRRNERAGAADRDRMRSMVAEIVISEERLRRSLAAELHDGLGQDIALAKMRLAVLRSSASVELHDPLSGIEQLVERADRSLRSITYQISPPSLHDLGLVAAIEWLAEDIGRKHGIPVRVRDDGSPGVADERIRVILFRAVRELLVNAATHAYAHEATVRLECQDDFVRITVEDDGIGFDEVDADGRGYGLFGIREQLKCVDGNIEIASAPGLGTKVTLTAPSVEHAPGPIT